jgi:hypothetical protein
VPAGDADRAAAGDLRKLPDNAANRADAADTTTVSPFFGLPISLNPESRRSSPGMPSAPR